jgi:hypothetical protein
MPDRHEGRARRVPVAVEVCWRQPSWWAAALSALEGRGLVGVLGVVWEGVAGEAVVVRGVVGEVREVRASPRGRAVVRTRVRRAVRVMRRLRRGVEVMVGSWAVVVVRLGEGVRAGVSVRLMAPVYAGIRGRASPPRWPALGEISRRHIRRTRAGH